VGVIKLASFFALAACASAFGLLACGGPPVPQSNGGSGWQERVFFDEACSNEEDPAAPPADFMAIHDALGRAATRAENCLRLGDHGTVLVAFGGAGCVRALLLEHPVLPRIEQCLVNAFAATRVPPLREGVVRPVSNWTIRQRPANPR